MADVVFAVNHTFHSGAVADGNGTAMDVGGLSAVAVQITGVTTATINYEGTIDGTNWVALRAFNPATGAVATTATANALVQIPVTGLDKLRCRISGWAAGTVVVKGKGLLGSAGFVLAA